MNPTLLALLIVGGVVLLLILIAVVIYNSLVSRRVETQNAWSQIDVQLKRRYDLIPNLVETVKGYMKHERETLEAVIAARNRAVTAEQTAAGRPRDPAAMQELQRADAGGNGGLVKATSGLQAPP